MQCLPFTRGQVNASLDADLNKITFCDTPWLFNKAYQGELSMDALKETWKQFPSSYLRLIAMGIDAYNLSTRLDNPWKSILIPALPEIYR